MTDKNEAGQSSTASEISSAVGQPLLNVQDITVEIGGKPLDDRQKAEIEAIDRALRRIAMGTYERCEACGKPIPMARLDALPTATRCVSCAEGRGQPPT